jgi:pimeloyl-ACP methyl ester carboxylesterase
MCIPIYAILILIIALYLIQTQAKQRAIAEYRAGGKIIQTPRGPVEYAIEGAGPAILVMHGSGGGYQQGMQLTRLIDTTRYTILAISRPGYWGTPLDIAPSHEEQADLAVEVLDVLKIKKAFVAGISAGGLAMIQFGLRHPDRCAGLIFLSAVHPNRAVYPMPSIMPLIIRLLLWSDFWTWLMTRSSLWLVADPTRLGLPQIVTEPTAAGIVQLNMLGLWPASPWNRGTFNDMDRFMAYASLPLEKISVPTLVIHGTRDLSAPLVYGEHAARVIPGAQKLIIPGGSHLVIGTHWREIGQRLTQFMEQNPSA